MLVSAPDWRAVVPRRTDRFQAEGRWIGHLFAHRVNLVCMGLVVYRMATYVSAHPPEASHENQVNRVCHR